MKRNRIIVTLVAVLLLVPSRPSVAAQKKGAKQTGKQKAPTSAEARQSVTAANRRIRDAEGDVKTLVQKAETAGRAAAKRCLASSGLGEAQATLKREQSAMAGTKATLLRVIHERSDWLAASDEAKDAGERLRALNTKELEADEKRKQRSELASIMGQPREIEERELGANPEYRQALEKLNGALAAERKARTQYARDLAKDEELKSAKDALSAAQKRLKDGQQELAESQRELAVAQRSEAQAKRAEQAKKQQQANQKNNKKKGNTNKGNSKKKGKK